MAKQRSLTSLQVANAIAFFATVVVNVLANSLALNGRTTGEISDLYPTLITPAGFTFAIWGVIYALLLVFVVFQLLPQQRQKQFIWQINIFFVLSSLFNILWLFLWHYDYIIWSVVPMFALLASLAAIYLRLQIGKSKVPLKEKLCIHLPFSVYLGWITVASITNVAAALVSLNWDGLGLGAVTWAILVIAVALLITIGVLITRKDVAYSLVIIWALVGIIANQSENQTVAMTAEVSIVIIAISMASVVLVSKIKR